MTTTINYFAGVYWGPRSDPIADCAQRTKALLEALAACHSELSRWNATWNSDEDVMAMGVEEMTQAIASIQDAGGPLGTGFILWPVDSEVGFPGGLHITCGSRHPRAPPNNCYLSLPRPGTVWRAEILNRPTLTALLEAMVVAWDPDWGFAAPESVWSPLKEASSTDTHLGWLTYITRKWGEVPPLSDVFGVEPLGDRGTLIALTEEPLTPEREQAMQLARRVQQQLLERGLLRQVGPARRNVQSGGL